MRDREPDRRPDGAATREVPATCTDAAPYALRVEGTSMAPEFPDGSVIVIDPTGHARDGAFVVAERADGLALRRLALDAGGAWRLEVLDGSAAPEPLDGGLGAVRGVVVQRAGRRRRDHRRYD